MDLRQLRYFLVVGEEEHFHRASRRLHVAQPALTRRMRDLENELGFKLFHRIGRGVRLTEAGRAYLEDTRQTLDWIEVSIERGRAIAAGKRGALRIGFNATAIRTAQVAKSFHAFRVRYPDVDLKLSLIMSQGQLAALRAKQIDAGFMYDVHLPCNNSEFDTVEVADENVVLALPKGYTLARRKSLAAADLNGAPFIWLARAQGPEYYDKLMSLCISRGLHPRIVEEVDNADTTLSLVSAGMGIAILPATSARRWNSVTGNVVFKTLRDLSMPMQLMLTWRREDHSAMLEQFVAIVR